MLLLYVYKILLNVYASLKYSMRKNRLFPRPGKISPEMVKNGPKIYTTTLKNNCFKYVLINWGFRENRKNQKLLLQQYIIKRTNKPSYFRIEIII